MNIIAQIFGIVGLIFVFISIQNNNKNKILFFQILANLFYGLQYLFLRALSAALMCFSSLIRCVIFEKYSKRRKGIPFFVLLFFVLLNIILGIVSFINIYNIIPVIISILYTYGIWQNNLKLFRIISVVVAIAWSFYNYFVGAYVALFGTFFELLSALIAIYRFDISKKEKLTNTQVNEQIL